MITINGKKYTGFWASILGLIIASWTLLLVGIVLVGTFLLLALPFIIPIAILVLLGVLIGKL